MAKDEFGDELEVRTPANDGLKERLLLKVADVRTMAEYIAGVHRSVGLNASAEAAEDVVRHIDETLKPCLDDID